MTYDENKTFPVFAGRILIRGNKMTCLAEEGQFVAQAPARLLERLFFLCDGQRSVAALVEMLARDWRKADVAAFIVGLLKTGVLVNVLDLGATVWARLRDSHATSDEMDIAALARTENARKVNLPSEIEIPVAAGALNETLRSRASASGFSGAEVPLAALGDMLWCAYGVLERRNGSNGIYHRTVPSAGGFCSLDVFLVLLRSCETLQAGIYQVVYGDAGQTGVRMLSAGIESIPRAVVDPSVLNGAQGLVLFAAAAEMSARKYGSRAALYASLEAGHAIQNLLLAAGQHAVATREVGGLFPNVWAQLLSLSSGAEIIGSVVCGMASEAQSNEQTNGQTNAIAFQWLNDATYVVGNTVLGRATQKIDGKQIVGWGYSPNPGIAHVKAVAEVIERRACMRPRDIEFALFGDVADAIDPRAIVAYCPAQYRQPDFPYAPFNKAATYGWKRGVDAVNGQNRHVLAEQVYFPDALSENYPTPYTGANSCGVAAHTTLAAAFENALLECVERDAFMCRWLSRTAPPRISADSLPNEFARRIREFAESGTELSVFDLSLDSVPVLMVAAMNHRMGFCTVGASANFDPLAALSHTFDEVVFRLEALHLQGQISHAHAIGPKGVRTPAQHARLYRQRRYFRQAEFLLDSASLKPFASITSQVRPGKLLDALVGLGLSPVLFDLTDTYTARAEQALHVVRSIVPGLVPMSFGYGTQPMANDRFARLRGHLGSAVTARRMSSNFSFPHPFA